MIAVASAPTHDADSTLDAAATASSDNGDSTSIRGFITDPLDKTATTISRRSLSETSCTERTIAGCSGATA